MSGPQANRLAGVPDLWYGRTVLVLLWILMLVPPGHADPWPAVHAFFQTGDPRTIVQEGEVTLHDGEEAQIHYLKPFQSPPQLMITECRYSWSPTKPYQRTDFQFIQQEATFFKIRNVHPERSVAVMRWRAVGLRVPENPVHPTPNLSLLAQDSKTRQVALITVIQRMGGKVGVETKDGQIKLVGIDLHGTQATDADLQQLQGLTGLRTLNLYRTAITDAGLASLAGLTGLQTLYLNDTRITDYGLQSLKGLTNLKELGLCNTQITDQGLGYLKPLTNLQSLTVCGPQITDRGLVQLRDLKHLRDLVLYRTQVTDAGLKDLKKALPGVRVMR